MAENNSSPIHIRRATSVDDVLLAELGARTFYDTFASDNTPENMAAYLAYAFSPEKQSAELADPHSIFLIAEIGESPAGYSRLHLGPPPAVIPGAHPIEIVRFYADKAWIGRGVGPGLMQACLEVARQLGCDSIWLDVWERNPRAIAFYRKWGFEVIGEQIFQLGNDPQRDLLMQRYIP